MSSAKAWKSVSVHPFFASGVGVVVGCLPISAFASSAPKTRLSRGAAIPDFMRVEVEGSESAAKMKKELLETLKPDKETVDEVMGNQALMTGFDDPEVMAAVEDVARDPKNMAKYAGNAKVVRFYQQMAGMVGKRLEKKGDNSASGV